MQLEFHLWRRGGHAEAGVVASASFRQPHFAVKLGSFYFLPVWWVQLTWCRIVLLASIREFMKRFFTDSLWVMRRDSWECLCEWNDISRMFQQSLSECYFPRKKNKSSRSCQTWTGEHDSWYWHNRKSILEDGKVILSFQGGSRHPWHDVTLAAV